MDENELGIKFEMASFRQMGERIQRLRLKRGYDQKDIAYELGITQDMVSNIERGEYSPYKHIAKICSFLNVNPVIILLKDPEIVLINASVENLVPVYTTKVSWIRQQPFYYYSAPNWIVHQYEKVFAIEAGVMDKSSILVDDTGLLFIAPRGRDYKYAPDDLVFGQIGFKTIVLKLKRHADLTVKDKKMGLVLAQERRFV